MDNMDNIINGYWYFEHPEDGTIIKVTLEPLFWVEYEDALHPDRNIQHLVQPKTFSVDEINEEMLDKGYVRDNPLLPVRKSTNLSHDSRRTPEGKPEPEFRMQGINDEERQVPDQAYTEEAPLPDPKGNDYWFRIIKKSPAGDLGVIHLLRDISIAVDFIEIGYGGKKYDIQTWCSLMYTHRLLNDMIRAERPAYYIPRFVCRVCYEKWCALDKRAQSL